MNGHQTNASPILCWSARILAVLLAGLVLLIFVGEALSDGAGGLLRLTTRESVMMIAFVVMWAGLLVGWRWPLLGGAMTLTGFAAFYLLDFAFSGTFPNAPTILLFAVPGLLFVACGLRSRPRSTSF